MSGPMTGFEGSYLGANDRLSDQAVMECKICWTPYDPAIGDEFRQVLPGTPFTALPDDWHCPNCDAPKEQFMVLSDPGAPAMLAARRMEGRVERLASDFREIWNARMRDLPMVNKALRVEAVGFVLHEGRPLGVLISPWFMNLIMLPREDEDWGDLTPGAKEEITFPSGAYEFLHNTREMGGGYKACSLFSPMGEFQTQAQAADVARAIMVELFREENVAETDRATEIRATREADLAETETNLTAANPIDPPARLSRRRLISGGLADEAGAPDA